MAWYNASWLYRKKITIDHTKVSANETTRPVLFKVSSDSDFAARARSDGYYFVITQSDGTTECVYDRRYFNSSTGELVLHFLANSLSSSTDVDYYIYYGNSGQSTDKASPSSVWTNYDAVWHLDEASGTRYDATSNNNDLTDNNTVTQTDGKIYKSAVFSRSNDEFLSIDDANITGIDYTGDFNVSALIYITDNSDESTIFAKENVVSTGSQYRFMTIVSSGVLDFTYTDNGGSTRGRGSTGISTNEWAYVAASVDVSAGYSGISFNVNGSTGSASNITNSATTIHNTSTKVSIGNHTNNGSIVNEHNGYLEEIRVHSGTETSDWFITEYNSVYSPSTFYTLGSQTTDTVDVPGEGLTLLGVS